MEIGDILRETQLYMEALGEFPGQENNSHSFSNSPLDVGVKSKA